MRRLAPLLLTILALVFVTISTAFQPSLVIASVWNRVQVATIFPTSTPNSVPPKFSEYEGLLQGGLQDLAKVQLIEVTDNRAMGGKRIIL